MRTIDLMLGGRTFTVRQLPIGPEQSWRDSIKPVIGPLTEALAREDQPIGSGAELAAAVSAAASFADGEALLEALCRYDPELEAEHEWLTENAYTDEAAKAVMALFFGQAARSQSNGAASKPLKTTRKSLP